MSKKRYLIIKSIADFTAALLALLIIFPLLVLIAAVLVISRQPVFFRQKRLGRYEAPFRIVKFCTMEPGEVGQREDERVTRVGRILRRYSLDEFPQLINVLRGEMSIVGPRPLLPEYLEHYSLEERRRHKVKPGITGWAQVNGGRRLSWEKQFSLDVEYSKKPSFIFDIYILYKTIFSRAYVQDNVDRGTFKR